MKQSRQIESDKQKRERWPIDRQIATDQTRWLVYKLPPTKHAGNKLTTIEIKYTYIIITMRNRVQIYNYILLKWNNIYIYIYIYRDWSKAIDRKSRWNSNQYLNI